MSFLTFVPGVQPDPLPVDCLGLPHWGVIALFNLSKSHRLNYVDILCGGQKTSDAGTGERNSALYVTSNLFTMRSVYSCDVKRAHYEVITHLSDVRRYFHMVIIQLDDVKHSEVITSLNDVIM